jgi:hypothetical protein
MRMGCKCIDDDLLTSVLLGAEWSGLRPYRFTPGERTHWGGRWVGPRASLDDTEK